MLSWVEHEKSFITPGSDQLPIIRSYLIWISTVLQNRKCLSSAWQEYSTLRCPLCHWGLFLPTLCYCHARRPELTSFRTETETQKTDNSLQNCQWFKCCHSPWYVRSSTSRTRTHERSYIQIQTNYEQYKNNFLPRTIREWNALPPDLVHAESVDDFSSRLQMHTA